MENQKMFNENVSGMVEAIRDKANKDKESKNGLILDAAAAFCQKICEDNLSKPERAGVLLALAGLVGGEMRIGKVMGLLSCIGITKDLLGEDGVKIFAQLVLCANNEYISSLPDSVNNIEDEEEYTKEELREQKVPPMPKIPSSEEELKKAMHDFVSFLKDHEEE